jgi:hypothetical protein
MRWLLNSKEYYMFEILKLDNFEGIESYKGILSSMSIVEPYYLVDYFEIFGEGLENLVCFCYTVGEGNSRIIMPGYLNPIFIGDEKTDYYDFITPYGYTGPFFSSSICESDICIFWRNVDKWYSENNVISEFIRFSLFNNHLNYSGNAFITMLNVKGKIIDEEQQWKDFDYKVRKNVNKAKRENLTSQMFYIDIPEGKILEFFEIYIQTMNRTGAKEKFLYSLPQFQKFLLGNKSHAAICTVYSDCIPVSSELILISKEAVFSFLGGTNEFYFDKRPNDFLKYEVLNWARSMGKKYFVLGGGYGFEDGIFKYKRSFFPSDAVNYYTGRKIINLCIYNYLLERMNVFRLEKGLFKLDLNDVSFFPLYNKII